MEILKLIGNTPLVKLSGFDTGLCSLFVKLECQNPSGSIKDRPALLMISDAEKNGYLKPGGTIVEATAGNTGLGLALIAAQKGYRIVLVVPDKMSREKILHLKALGAEVVLTRSDVEKGHPDYYQDRAKTVAREIPGAWYSDQFNNPSNPLAHELGTGPEIWQQMNQSVDAIVVGVGSGGTLGGLTRYFSKTAPNLEMVLADPEGSVLAPFITTGRLPSEVGSWLVEGIGEDFIPSNADFSMVKAAYAISDKESFLTARTLLRTDGILGGSSSGTLIAAASRYCQAQTTPKRVVTFICDTGSKYLSKMFSDFWMEDNRLLSRGSYGDLRDLISHPQTKGAVVSVTPEEKLKTAYTRMKMYEVSQLPVLDSGRVVGLIDESDLLFALRNGPQEFKRPVSQVMSTKLKTVKPNDSHEKVFQLLKNGLVAIVADESTFYGIITRIDVVEYLRNQNYEKI